MPLIVWPKEPKEVTITVEFIVNEDSQIFIGKKQVKIDDIPENGLIIDLQTEGNKVKKVVYEEKK
jgi:hypothetical protein